MQLVCSKFSFDIFDPNRSIFQMKILSSYFIFSVVYNGRLRFLNDFEKLFCKFSNLNRVFNSKKFGVL